MNTDVVIHVGYGKTATTWLQDRVFAGLGEEAFLGKYDSYFPDWLLRLNYLDDFAFSSKKEDLRVEILSVIRGRRRAIISSEAFTNLGVIYQQIERMKFVFDNPRIVLVLRNPIDWLVSNYKYCVEYEQFNRPLESYIDFGTMRTPFALEKRAPFYVPDFYYTEVAARYRNAFGSDRVLVLRYEDLVLRPRAFGEALSRFIGIPLENFEHTAGEKVLKSKDLFAVERVRMENMAAYISEAGFTAEGLVSNGGNRVPLSQATINKLKTQLGPYCVEFYPELLT
jgi:hypothetical protein